MVILQPPLPPPFNVDSILGNRLLKPRLHERFFASNGDVIENRMCSHPRIGDATDEKIAEKNREKFNELNFLRQNYGLHQTLSPSVATTARWRSDSSQKNRSTIASKKSLV